MSGRRIELRIDELILHGFEPGDRHRIGEAVQNELGRLLRGQGTPLAAENRGRIDVIKGGAFTVTPGGGPESTGMQIARAVHDGIASNRRK